jgi:3-isopropylmalate/(R)-2-methylmalate dehydratase small subunit
MQIRGNAWVFGDNMDTDLIAAGQYLEAPVEEAAKHAFEAINPSFAKEAKPGDIIVAGRNFGCGSSRENAPQVLKHLGISCILADSFARIFFRNAIAIGLPVLVLKDLAKIVKPMEIISISLDSSEVTLEASGKKLLAKPLPEKMKEIINAGGIDGLLNNLAKAQ